MRERLMSGDELNAAQRADAGRKAAELIKAQQQVKASEALGQQMEKGMKRTTTTQSDRTRVGGGNIGGASFPAISEADPAYAGKVWGVMDSNTAKRLTNLTTPETAWTTMLGSANQLKTNPIVFDKLKRGFVTSMKQGNLSDELAGKINQNLELTFGKGADIRDPKIWRQADTFDKRAALADVMMGQGTAPSKGGVAIGGEKSGKGVIFKPTDILKRETEPSLLHTEHGGDVPTFAAGPRLFRIDKEAEYRPDLHPGYPTLLRGEDLGVNMMPTPTEVYLPDWHKQFKKNNPDRKPSYYDLALGVKGEGLPSQELNDEYIRHLLREGFKKGGAVNIEEADQRLKEAIQKRMAKGGGVNIEEADAKLRASIQARMGMAQGGEVGFKKIQFMAEGGSAFKKLEFMADGGKLVKGIGKIGKKLMAEEQVASDAIGKAAESAGMKAPVTANKPLTNLQDFHTSFGDSVRKRAMDMQATMDSLNYKYDKGQRVFTEDSARKNWPPMTVLGRVLEGNRIMREDPTDFLSKKIVDEATGKAKRTPYEAGYKVRLEHAPDNWSEFVIPETAIKGNVDFARGGLAYMDKGGKAGKVVSGLASVGKRLLADAPVESPAAKQMRLNMMPTARIGLEAPGILIPSKMNNVREAVRNMKGNYGARRVERAADEIPNLEKMYQEDALKEAFTGDNASAMITLSPAEFERYAAELTKRSSVGPKMAELAKQGDIDKMTVPTDEYIKHLQRLQGGFDDVPYLNLFKDEVGIPTNPKITGHEGRHRSRALAESGAPSSLVKINPRGDLREGMPRRTQEDFIEALREELERSNRLVIPESEPYFRRPNVELPDVYAEGGAAFKKLQFMDKGGITTSAGSFSPEELGVTANDLRLIDDKTLQRIKNNAPATYDWIKQNIKDEASQLKTPRGVKDFALRVGASYAGGIPDLLNLGAMGVDLVQSAIPSISKPESVLDVADSKDRIPKFKLASDKPWFGSQQYIDAMHKAGALGESEFPIAEGVATVLMPAGLIKKGIKKGAQLFSGKKPEELKKRRGGLAAMAR